MGIIGGGLYYAVKGFRNAPRGRVLLNMSEMVRMRTPALASGFALWGGTFSVFDCTFAGLRGKEDPYNAIASGAATGAALSIRAGWRVMLTQAAIGGVFLALIEGFAIFMQKNLPALIGNPDLEADPDVYPGLNRMTQYSSANVPPPPSSTETVQESEFVDKDEWEESGLSKDYVFEDDFEERYD